MALVLRILATLLITAIAAAQNIDTPSGAQVARGLSAQGLGQWRRYARELEPVLPWLAPFAARFGYPEN